MSELHLAGAWNHIYRNMAPGGLNLSAPCRKGGLVGCARDALGYFRVLQSYKRYEQFENIIKKGLLKKPRPGARRRGGRGGRDIYFGGGNISPLKTCFLHGSEPNLDKFPDARKIFLTPGDPPGPPPGPPPGRPGPGRARNAGNGGGRPLLYKQLSRIRAVKSLLRDCPEWIIAIPQTLIPQTLYGFS